VEQTACCHQERHLAEFTHIRLALTRTTVVASPVSDYKRHIAAELEPGCAADLTSSGHGSRW